MHENDVAGGGGLAPAPWVGFRSYRACGASRAVLSNERDHTLATLDGPSAEIWSAIERNASLEDLIQLAERLGCARDLPAFIDLLKASGTVADDRARAGLGSLRAAPPPPPRKLDHASNVDTESRFMEWAADHGFLYSAHWEVTFRCNERCVHCYNPGAAHAPGERPRRSTDELSTEEARLLLDEMAAAGVFRLTLSGGEVTLRYDLFDLVAHARRLGMAVALYTNGLNLDEAYVARLASCWPSSVAVSVYSTDPAAHDAITGVPGSFERSLRALGLLHAAGIRTQLKSVQMHHTLGGYRAIEELGAAVGAAAEIDMHMSAAMDGAQAPAALAAQDAAALVLLAMTPGSPLDVGGASSDFNRRVRDSEASVCGAGITMMYVDPEGGIYPCSSLPMPAGRQREEGFLSVWRRSRIGRRLVAEPAHDGIELDPDAVLARWQDIRLRDYHECGTHRRCAWCTKCPGLSMLEHGDALAPATVNCRLAAARMVAADLLVTGETRESFARRASLDPGFGRLPPRRLPVLQATPCGGPDPRSLGVRALVPVAAARDAARPPDDLPPGDFEVRTGVPATRAALAEVAAVRARLALSEAFTLRTSGAGAAGAQRVSAAPNRGDQHGQE